MKQKLINQYYAMLYQFLCVPLLAFSSIMLYYRFVYVRLSDISLLLQGVITIILILFNLVVIYGIAYLLKKVFKMPLINYVLTGIVTIVGIAAVNVYFSSMEQVTCSQDSAIACVANMNHSKLAMTILITYITYFCLYLVIQKIVDKQLIKKEA